MQAEGQGREMTTPRDVAGSRPQLRKIPSHARKLNRIACRLAAKVRIGPVHYLIAADRLASTGPVLPKRGVLKISFECSILYRLPLLSG